MNSFVSLNTILGNGKFYQVPVYQRDFSWRRNDEIEDMWNDLLELEQEGGQHYMGYIVLRPIENSNERFEIIDGQQRLTSLSLLALAIINLLKRWANEGNEPILNAERSKEEYRRYLGNIDTTSESKSGFLPVNPKLTLNRNNDDYYKSYLLQDRKPIAVGSYKPSVRLLQSAYDFFVQKLEAKYESNKSGVELSRFLERVVGNGLVFTTIEVPNDLVAFKVFETLNARGVKLSPADLLKNYLFSQAAGRGQLDLEEAERRWMNISNQISKNDLTTFIRHYWNSRYKITRQPVLFKAIKNQIDSGDKVFQLLDALERQAEYYTAFQTPYDGTFWDKEERQLLVVLNLLDVSTCYSLMLAYLENLLRKDFSVLLRELVVISFRYSISQLNPNEAELVYSEVANRIYSGELTEVKAVIKSLKSIYVNDSKFEQDFSSVRINTRRKKNLVKYILIQIENKLSNTDLPIEDSKSTIEHILPENPGDVWTEYFSPEIQDEFIDRLGNYTLLSAGINHKLGNNLSFQGKMEYYRQSVYKLTREYCPYDQFTPRTLDLRQEEMAKVAKGIWRSGVLG